jgi:hypothetical protein
MLKHSPGVSIGISVQSSSNNKGGTKLVKRVQERAYNISASSIVEFVLISQ